MPSYDITIKLYMLISIYLTHHYNNKKGWGYVMYIAEIRMRLAKGSRRLSSYNKKLLTKTWLFYVHKLAKLSNKLECIHTPYVRKHCDMLHPFHMIIPNTPNTEQRKNKVDWFLKLNVLSTTMRSILRNMVNISTYMQLHTNVNILNLT